MSEPAPKAPLRAKHTRISFEDGAAPSALPSILKNKKVRQAPINRARDTICKALESLELVSEEKKNDLATTITNHFKAINKKRTVLEKFQDDFIPKPLRIKPSIKVSNRADEEFQTSITEQEKEAIETYQKAMTTIMESAAQKELELVLLDLIEFSVQFTTTLVEIWKHTNMTDDSEESIGNPNFIVLKALKMRENEEDTQSKQLMFGLFSGCNIGSELLKFTNVTDLKADTDSYSRLERAKECYAFVHKHLKASLYDSYDAYITAYQKEEAILNFDSLFDLKKKETAATAMEIEFEDATGPAAAIVNNNATDEKIKAMEKEIKKLQQQQQQQKSKNSTGAERTANAKKKSASKKSSHQQQKRNQRGRGRGRDSSRGRGSRGSQRS
jgi:hypothetical protein